MSAHQTLSVRYCTPADCTDPRCPNFQQAAELRQRDSQTVERVTERLIRNARARLIDQQQRAYAQARWQELAGAK